MNLTLRSALLTLVIASSSVSGFAPLTVAPRQSSSTKLYAVNEQQHDFLRNARNTAVAVAFAVGLFASPGLSLADGSTKEFKLPPIDFSDTNRCKFSGSKMGQANAARDKLYDLRQCNLSGENAQGLDLSGVIMSKTDVSKVNFQDAQFSKGYLRDSNFDGADFSNAIVDRASFSGSSLRNTIFVNAVLTGTSFENADVEGADFTDAYIGDFDKKALCKNPTLKGENAITGADTRFSATCGLK